MRLTDQFIKGLKPDTTRREFADDSTPGLKLRVGANGRRTFAFVGWSPSQRRAVRIPLGTYPETSLAEARRKAQDARKALSDGTPTAARSMTLATLLGSWLDGYAKSQRATWKRDQSLINQITEAMGSSPMATLRRGALVQWLEDYGKRAPSGANKLSAILKQAFDWGVTRELIASNPLASYRSAPGGIERPKDRVLSTEEIRTFQATLTSTAHAAIWTVLLTGQRPGECAAMRIEDLDLDAGIWSLSAEKMKSRRAHKVPLTSFAIEHLRKHIGDRKIGPVFGGQNRMLPIGRSALTMAAWSSGQGWSPHDLRRTAATGMREMGCSVSEIGALLAHAEQGVTAAVYALSDRMPEKTRARDALELWLKSVLVDTETAANNRLKNLK
jgi:integrase